MDQKRERETTYNRQTSKMSTQIPTPWYILPVLIKRDIIPVIRLCHIAQLTLRKEFSHMGLTEPYEPFKARSRDQREEK